MTSLIYSVIFWFILKASRCQLPCDPALAEKPDISVDPMEEGKHARLRCYPHKICSSRGRIRWTWTKANGQYEERNPYFRNLQTFQKILQFTPTAEYHNTNITCVAEYDHAVASTTVTLTVKFRPKMLNGSQCLVDGRLLVCVCNSWGNPPPLITWPLVTLTDYSISSSRSVQTVKSTITMSAADYHNTMVKCISSNELGQAEIEIPFQNSTEKLRLHASKDKSDAVFPWIIAGVSLTLNLVLLSTLIVCTYKRKKNKSQEKKLGEESNTYASLDVADVGLYSVISSQNQ